MVSLVKLKETKMVVAQYSGEIRTFERVNNTFQQTSTLQTDEVSIRELLIFNDS